MSKIGYYRYKLDNLPVGNTTISFYINGALAVTHSIVVKPYCTGEKLIKYLDKDGQYRFYPFNKYYEERIDAKLIGKTNEFITSILTAQSNEKNIGYKSAKTLSLIATVVTAPNVANPISFTNISFNVTHSYYSLQNDVQYSTYPFATETRPNNTRLLAYRFRACYECHSREFLCSWTEMC